MPAAKFCVLTTITRKDREARVSAYAESQVHGHTDEHLDGRRVGGRVYANTGNGWVSEWRDIQANG